MDPFGARPMRRRSHARDKALLLAEPHDVIRIRGDDDLVKRMNTGVLPDKPRRATECQQSCAASCKGGASKPGAPEL